MAGTPWHAFAEALGIERITPAGDDVPSARQLVVHFDAPVVALGVSAPEPERSPVQIRPRLACQWRWLSPRALACQLGPDQAMTPATRYQVVVAAGLTSVVH